MIWLYIILTIVAIALGGAIVWWWTPKGTILYEALDLVPFWSKLFTQPLMPMQEFRYEYGEHWRQYLLLLKPQNDAPERKHIIIYFHGGAWRVGRPEQFRVNAQLFVQKGYHVILPSYRRVPFFNYHHLREDLDYILQMLKSICEAHGIEDKKIILGGISAGANLAALMLYNRSALEAVQFDRSLFSAIFMLAAPLDMKQMKDTRFLRFYCGDPQSEAAQVASPITYLQEDEVHDVLCIHGTADGLVPFGNSRSFVDRFRDINPYKIEFVILKNATHLDLARWAYQVDEVRIKLLEWIDQVEEKELIE